MHEIVRTTSGNFLKIVDALPVENIENSIPILGDRQDLPSDLSPQILTELRKNGDNWDYVELAEAVTGVYRYTSIKGGNQGNYYTNILSWSASEAIKRLKLPPENAGQFKQRVEIQPTKVAVGEIKDSKETQIYVFDPHTDVEVCEWTATNADFISNR